MNQSLFTSTSTESGGAARLHRLAPSPPDRPTFAGTRRPGRPSFYWMASVCALLLPSWAFSQSDGVEGDPLGRLNQGLYQYVQARSIEEFQAAITVLDGIRPSDAGYDASLLLRALCRGQIGLRVRQGRLTQETVAEDCVRILEVRATPEGRAALDREREKWEAMRTDPNVPPAEKLVAEETLGRLNTLLVSFDTDAEAGKPDEALQAERDAALRRAHSASRQEGEVYRRMLGDLGALMKIVDRPEVIIRLLEVIAESKAARADEDESVRLKSGESTRESAGASLRQLRGSARSHLERAADVLGELWESGAGSADERVRIRFFLGVIHYRLGVPRRSEDEPADLNLGNLEESERLMRNLVDDATVDPRWRSYASLYLGLILPLRAASLPDRAARDAVLDDALRSLVLALEFDVVPSGAEGAPPESASRGGIPFLVSRQREQISRLRTSEPTVTRRRNDLQLTLFTGLHRDTNVVLLGERTDLPREISRKRDYGFSAGAALDYTLDLSDGWMLGLQLRTSQLWHADVDEFDEQRYGGSVAVQYELVPDGERFGPVYARLQYDYDNYLLGRDAFLESHSLTPDLRIYAADRRSESNIYFTYSNREYHEPLFDRRFNRDGEYFATGATTRYKLVDMTPEYQGAGVEPWGHSGDEWLAQDDPDYPARYLAPFLGLQYAWDSTDGDEFDQKEYTLLGGVTVPLPYGIDLEAGTEFNWQEYQHGSRVDYHRRGRRDFVQRYSLAFSRTFVLRAGDPANRFTPAMDRVWMTLRAHADWTNDDSNVVDRFGQSVFEYDRVVYGVTVAFSFN